MQRESLVPLEDMRQYAADALAMSVGQTRGTYSADMRLRYAIERCLTIIGEALSALRKIDPDTASRITGTRQIIGMRHIFIHAYRLIDDDKAWAVVENHLPLLLDEVKRLIDEGIQEHLPESQP